MRHSPGWSTASWILGLPCKESAAVAPALIATAWALGLGRPSRGRMLAFRGLWGGVWGGVLRRAGAGCFIPHPRSSSSLRSHGASRPAAMRLPRSRPLPTSRACCSSPHPTRGLLAQERTIVSTPLDGRFAAGVVAHRVGTLLVLAWALRPQGGSSRARVDRAPARPSRDLLFPSGVLIAERTLYLPSVGLALAAGAVARGLRGRALGLLVGVVAVLGGARTVARVPVWRSNLDVTLSILQDSPRLVRRPMATAAFYSDQGRATRHSSDPDRLLRSFRWMRGHSLMQAHAALKLERRGLAAAPVARGSRLQPLSGGYMTRRSQWHGDWGTPPWPATSPPRAAVAEAVNGVRRGFHDGTSPALAAGGSLAETETAGWCGIDGRMWNCYNSLSCNHLTTTRDPAWPLLSPGPARWSPQPVSLANRTVSSERGVTA